MPTDFSFVTPEGWEALRSKFDGAQKKLQQKVEKKETTPEFGRRLTDLMEKKYQHWSSGKGMKEKENQTALQEKEKATRRASAMRRLAYLGRQSTIDIADAALKGEFSNGLDFNTANFLKVLEMNGTNVAEFFQVLAERITDPDFFDAVSRDAGLMPGQMAGLLSKKFGDWGFEKEVRPVVDAARGAVRQQPAAPAAPATTPAVPGESLSADEPPAATQPASTAVNAPSTSGLVEPRAWPQNVKVPPPSQSGPAYDWYFRFIPPGEKAPSAGIAKGLNQTDAVSFVHYLQGLGYSPQRSIPLKNFAKESPESAAFVSRVTGAPASPGAPAAKPAAPAAQAPAAPAAAKPAVPPAPAAMQPKPGHSGTVPGETGQIDAPDPADPKTYRWAIKYKLKSGFITDPGSVDLTGAQMAEQLKEYQRMGVEVLELKKMSIVNQASIEVSDGDLRFAADGAPEEKFKAGTPIIFKEDVNLKFDALSARGQIKKNMTGKIKKVEDNDYLIDIAGQFYRLPRLVAEHVMDVFAAVVIPNEEQESAAEPQPQADGQAAQPQAPGAQPQAAPASAPSASPAPATAQARFEAAGMPRVAGTENPQGGDKANFEDLHLLLKEQDKNHIKFKDKNDAENKPASALPQQTAAAIPPARDDGHRAPLGVCNSCTCGCRDEEHGGNENGGGWGLETKCLTPGCGCPEFTPCGVEHKNNPSRKTAAVQQQGFADLLLLIESGAPGIPSEIGKRLYRADAAVSRISR